MQDRVLRTCTEFTRFALVRLKTHTGKEEFAVSNTFPVQCFLYVSLAERVPNSPCNVRITLSCIWIKNSNNKFQQLIICKNLPNCSLQCHPPPPAALPLYKEIYLTSLFTYFMKMVRLRRGLRAMRRSKGAIRCSFVAGLRLRRKLRISFDFNCTCKLHIIRQQHKIKRVVPS
jgi:hypothetical protein